MCPGGSHVAPPSRVRRQRLRDSRAALLVDLLRGHEDGGGFPGTTRAATSEARLGGLVRITLSLVVGFRRGAIGRPGSWRRYRRGAPSGRRAGSRRAGHEGDGPGMAPGTPEAKTDNADDEPGRTGADQGTIPSSRLVRCPRPMNPCPRHCPEKMRTPEGGRRPRRRSGRNAIGTPASPARIQREAARSRLALSAPLP